MGGFVVTGTVHYHSQETYLQIGVAPPGLLCCCFGTRCPGEGAPLRSSLLLPRGAAERAAGDARGSFAGSHGRLEKCRILTAFRCKDLR